MPFLIVNIILIAFYSFAYNFVKTKRVKLLLYLVACLQIILIIGLRKDTVGTDIVAYKAKFFDIFDMPFSSIFYPSTYPVTIRDSEVGFVVLTKILCVFGNNFYVYLFFITLIIFVPIFFVIYKISDNPLLSLFLFIALQFMNFCASGLRQSLAFSMCFVAFFSLIKRKYFLFIVFTLLAFSFHKSSLIFLIVLFFPIMKWKIRGLFVFMFVFFLVFAFKNYFYNAFSFLFGYSSYEFKATNAFGLMLFSLFVFISSFLFLNKENKTDLILISTSAFSSLFMIFTSIGNNSARIAFYFFILSSIIIPRIIATSKIKFNLFIFTAIILVIGAFYYFTNTIFLYSFGDYRFLWE